MNRLTFEYPAAFLILLVFLLCLKWCRARGVSFYFPNISLLRKVSQKRTLLINFLKIMTVSMMVGALASPVIEDEVINRKDQGYEISLILDASGSMARFGKFDIVKDIVSRFIDERKHDKLALSIFADFAYVAIPLTYDKKSIKRLLDHIEVGVAGTRRTALYEALFLSSNLFKTSKAKEKIAILLTDGMNNVNTIPLDVAVKTAKKYGIKVYTAGVGREGMDFDPSVLKKIAHETGGKYFAAGSAERLKEIYATINRLEKSEIKADKYVKKRYYFQYLLALALIFAALYFYAVNRE